MPSGTWLNRHGVVAALHRSGHDDTVVGHSATLRIGLKIDSDLKRPMLEGGHAAVEADEDVVAASRVRELEKRVRDLERMLGRKTMENKSSSKPRWLAQKTDLALGVLERSRGQFPMSAVARTLGIAPF